MSEVAIRHAEKPILFTGPMVQAIYADLKTQTRRVVKLPEALSPGFEWQLDELPDGRWLLGAEHAGTGEGALHSTVRCPYGQPGTRLWVRESWAVHECYDGLPPREIELGPEDTIFYEATPSPGMAGFIGCPRRSIHMPKWATRLWLEVVSVRVERLQDITTEDIWAEGIQVPVSDEEEDDGVLWRMAPSNAAGKVPASYLPGRLHPGQPPITVDEVAMAHFADLWDSLNLKHPWHTNPWVWCIEFKRLEVGP